MDKPAILSVLSKLLDGSDVVGGRWDQGPYHWYLAIYSPYVGGGSLNRVGQMLVNEGHVVQLVKDIPANPNVEFAGDVDVKKVSLDDPEMVSKVKKWLTELL